LTRRDDSSLTPDELKVVQKHALLLLDKAAAIGRYPTPIADLMDAAKLTVVSDEVLDERFLARMLRRAKATVATLKTALSKVLGLFEPHERLVMIDQMTPKPRIPFVKLHEAGHGLLPHQQGMYRLIHDCEGTLDPFVSDLFEREANVFASEVLFQGGGFAEEAHSSAFSLKVPLKLAAKYGASPYASFRRYASTNPRSCALIVLNKPVYNLDGGFIAELRRVICSESFIEAFPTKPFDGPVGPSHLLGPSVPAQGKKMTRPKEVVLTDRNGVRYLCNAEAFNTTHYVLILLVVDRAKPFKIALSK